MKKIWLQIPLVFRACILVSVGVLIVGAGIAGCVKDAWFGVQTAVVGGFSVALLCAHVVWTSTLIERHKGELERDKTGDVATSIQMRIQIASLVKLFGIAAILILFVVGFHFNAWTAVIGVTATYLPIAVVPLFFKYGGQPLGAEVSAQDEAPERSEGQKP